MFLGVRNPESDDEDVYHLYSRRDDVYEGYSYELEWFTDGDPVLNEFSLVKKAALESKDLSNLKSALLGEWETVDFRTRFDSRDSDYDQLEEEKLQIKLNQTEHSI